MSEVRSVDANKLLEYIELYCGDYFKHGKDAYDKNAVRIAIKTAPTIEPPVVRGEWIDWKDKFGFKGTIVFCSVCDNHSDYKSRYCSNCGTKMGEETN